MRKRLISVCAAVALLFVSISVANAGGIYSRSVTLLDAVKSGDMVVARQLINEGVNINELFELDGFKHSRKKTALHVAIEIGDPEMIRLLLDNGAGPGLYSTFDDRDEFTPLEYAVMNNRLEIIRLLVDKGADINAGSSLYNPLLLAIGDNKAEIARLLLELGANPNYKEQITGSTPLHLIAYDGNIDIANLLLQFNVKADVKDKRGNTPLDIALRQHGSNIELIHILQKRP